MMVGKGSFSLKKILMGVAAMSLISGVAITMATAFPVKAATVTVEYGGSWSYGSDAGGWGWGGGLGKITYSNLASSSRWKNTTAVISGVSNYSGNQQPGITAYASQGTPYPWDQGYSYYNIW